MKALPLTALLACATLMLPQDVAACRAPRPSPEGMVSSAEVIVRVTAVRYVRAPTGNIRELNEPANAEIEFKIEERLKGENVPPTITLNGYLTNRDDFNDRPVPYDFVRKGGRGGSCGAYEYKRGAEFLLFLKNVDGKLTTRWYALAPTNEQLRSADDPWLVWVRGRLKYSGGRELSENALTLEAFGFTLGALRRLFAGAV